MAIGNVLITSELDMSENHQPNQITKPHVHPKSSRQIPLSQKLKIQKVEITQTSKQITIYKIPI